jgi:hypothetical protein
MTAVPDFRSETRQIRHCEERLSAIDREMDGYVDVVIDEVRRFATAWIADRVKQVILELSETHGAQKGPVLLALRTQLADLRARLPSLIRAAFTNDALWAHRIEPPKSDSEWQPPDVRSHLMQGQLPPVLDRQLRIILGEAGIILRRSGAVEWRGDRDWQFDTSIRRLVFGGDYHIPIELQAAIAEYDRSLQRYVVLAKELSTLQMRIAKQENSESGSAE